MRLFRFVICFAFILFIFSAFFFKFYGKYKKGAKTQNFSYKMYIYIAFLLLLESLDYFQPEREPYTTNYQRVCVCVCVCLPHMPPGQSCNSKT